MGKTSEAAKRASRKYAKTVDKAGVVLPKGTKEKIVGMGEAGVSQYINRLVEKDLKGRHRDIVKYARERIQKDIDRCKTVEEWHESYHSLLGDFTDEVLGEADFEGYIESTLGEKALALFLKNVTIPMFTKDTIRRLEAVDDFFDSREISWAGNDWAGTDQTMSGETREQVKKINSPEFMAEEDYKYLAHLYATAVVRSEQLEAGIVGFLGQEAFDRLVAQGSYEKDNLYYAAMASTKNKARQSRLFVDWLAGRGIFAPDPPDAENGIEAEGWTLPSDPPKAMVPVTLLLADGAERTGVYVPKAKNGKPQWLSGQIDYSAIVIGYKLLSFDAEEGKEENSIVEDAWKEVMATTPNLPADEKAARDVVGENIGKDMLDAVVDVLKVGFPPPREKLMTVGDVICAAGEIVRVMGSTGICRVWKIARMARDLSNTVEIMAEDAVRFAMTALINSKIVEYGEFKGVVARLTKKGIVHYDDLFGELGFTPSVLDTGDLGHEADVASIESTLLHNKYDILNEYKRDLPGREKSLVDIYATKNGKEFAVECLAFRKIGNEKEKLEDLFRRLKAIEDKGLPSFVVMFGKNTKDVWERYAPTLLKQNDLHFRLLTFDGLHDGLEKDQDCLLKQI